MNDFPWITFLTLTPFFGGVILLVMSGWGMKAGAIRGAAAVISLGVLAAALVMAGQFEVSGAGMQFVERRSWIPGLGVEYFVGLDGLGLAMVILTGILVPFALLASSATMERPALYYALVLFLEAGLIGTFTALNFFHWFLFWEFCLVPAFFLIRLWGGVRRGEAATQFFVYTMVGSVTMLLGFLALFLGTGTFDFLVLGDLGGQGGLGRALGVGLQLGGDAAGRAAMVIFLGVLLGFAVKVPLFPFHTWLPLTYAEAPTPVTMLLTGALSKMGVYGFLRILLPIFPHEMRSVLTPLLWLAVLTILASAWAALAQRDLKRMLAYSSINHLGYCLLGVFATARFTGPEAAWAIERAAALNGVVLQMFNHGLTAAALFCFLGFIESRTGGRRGLDDFGGLRKVAPILCGLMGISLFASLGLPGLNGFVGEFLIFKGSYSLATWATSAAAIGLLLTAVFLLTLLQRVFNGPLNENWSGFKDLTRGEICLVLPVTALLFGLGIFPQSLIHFVNPAVVNLISRLPL